MKFNSKSESLQLYEVLRLKKNELNGLQYRLEEMHQEITRLIQEITDLSSSNFVIFEKNTGLEKEVVKMSIEKNFLKEELDKFHEDSHLEKKLLNEKLDELKSLKNKYEKNLKMTEQNILETK